MRGLYRVVEYPEELDHLGFSRKKDSGRRPYSPSEGEGRQSP